MNKYLLIACMIGGLLSGNALAIGLGDPGPFGFDGWSITEPGPLDPADVDVIGSAVFIDDELLIGSPDCMDDGDEGSCSGNPGYDFAFTTTIDEDAYLTFDWIFETSDVDGPFYDRLGVWRNDEFFQLINAFLGDFDGPTEMSAIVDDPNNQSGSAGINVQAGDVFGFGLISDDSCCGPSNSVLNNFASAAYGSGPDGPFQPQVFVPVPAAVYLFGSAFIVLFGRLRRLS